MTRRLWLAILPLAAACGGDGGEAGGPSGPSPDYALSVAPSTLTIVIGEEGEYSITITRSGGFAGEVAVSLDNLPRGVTSTPTTISGGQTTGTLSVVVGSAAEPGVFALTVRASAQGLVAKSTDATLVTRIVT